MSGRDYQAVVFDVGGVLIEWDPRRLYRALLPDDAAVEHFLATVCTPQWNHEQDRGRPTAEAVAELTTEFPEHAELIAAYYDRWDEMLGDAIGGTVAILRDLRRAGVRVLALTNFSTEKWPLAVERFPFLGEFDGVVVSGAERLAKPDPAIFDVLCARYAVAPARSVYVDDLTHNAEAAAAYGFDALLFTGAAALRTELTDRGLLAVAAHSAT